MAEFTEAEPKCGDAEKREEADDVGHGGDKRPRRDRRIGAQAREQQRNQDPAERRGGEHADHRQPDDQAKIGDIEPGGATTPMIKANATPLSSPTENSRRTITRQALARLGRG